MQISSVEPQKRNPGRFNIFLDNKFAFGADEDLVVNFRLAPGKEINPEVLEKLLFEAEVGKLVERIYQLFNFRARSEKEIRDYLKNLSFKRKLKDKEEISELVTERLLEKLKEKGMLNDQIFAASWVESRRRSKKKGVNALKAELYQKGIDKDIIEEVLQAGDRESEIELAKQALERKIKAWESLPELEKRKKAIEFLLRRGFEYSIAKKVVEENLKK